MKKLELFVPGRLCVIGEHSDWAGVNRLFNASIVPGMAIVTGIEQGIYATVEKADKFIVTSDIESFKGESFECEMDTEKLRETASNGGFFSYVAGVTSYINEHYRVEGIKVNITKMDLPIKSGLSSSAAICVLITRAFNKLYNLHLNTIGEMNIAYMGELRTPSRCGRLDQACAFGKNPVCMIFDGNDINVRPLSLKTDLYWVVSNLNSSKDTVKILADLNDAYPFAKNDIQRSVQEALGEDNKKYVEEAISYIENGEVEKLGKLLVSYQENFDKKVASACSELVAPVLHSLLTDSKVKEYTYGAKGVGSQGDGSIQFLAKDEKSQKELIKYLKEEKGLDPVPFTLYPEQKIKKAIIPVAGFGTRLFPATKNLKKSFFPIMDKDGLLKPVLAILLEQLDEAGIEQICLVIGEDERSIYDEFFKPLSKEYYDKLPNNRKVYEDLIVRIGKKITYVVQSERKGFGHAVYLCKDFANDDPVLLLLGDMIYRSNINENCMSQMINVYEKYRMPIISMHKIEKENVVHYGIMHGKWENKEETILKLDEIKEKPSVDYAEDYLSVSTKQEKENYYAVFGQYVLTKDIFDILKQNIDDNKLENGEIQLTSALEKVRSTTGTIGYVVSGKSYDVGLPDKYYATINSYVSNIKQELKD